MSEHIDSVVTIQVPCPIPPQSELWPGYSNLAAVVIPTFSGVLLPYDSAFSALWLQDMSFSLLAAKKASDSHSLPFNGDVSPPSALHFLSLMLLQHPGAAI